MPDAPKRTDMHLRTRILVPGLVLLASCAGLSAEDNKKPKKASDPSPLDRYVEDAMRRPASPNAQSSPGSLWTPASRLTTLGSDLRASQVDDLITILVSESASAVVTGATKTQRQSSLQASVTSLAGVKSPTGALANLAGASSQSALDGSGTTSRSTTLSTALSARIREVLPNGYLVVEGSKDVVVNSEHQLVTVRGVVRPIDLTTDNIIQSNQIAQLELKIDGKGVVGDAIRRPFILWRLLMGILPF
jgi:flagellar L-ring protein FlgH